MADQQGATPADAEPAATADEGAEDTKAQDLLAAAVAADDGGDADDEQLGDAGKKALQREREARKAAEKAKTEAEAKVKEFENAQLSERERLEKERDEAKESAVTTAQEAALYKAAVNYGLSAEDLELLEGVPADQVDSRAKRLSERLAVQNGARAPKPDPSQGSRGPVDINAQIAEAEEKGDVKTAIALKSRQLHQLSTK